MLKDCTSSRYPKSLLVKFKVPLTFGIWRVVRERFAYNAHVGALAQPSGHRAGCDAMAQPVPNCMYMCGLDSLSMS